MNIRRLCLSSILVTLIIAGFIRIQQQSSIISIEAENVPQFLQNARDSGMEFNLVTDSRTNYNEKQGYSYETLNGGSTVCINGYSAYISCAGSPCNPPRFVLGTNPVCTVGKFSFFGNKDIIDSLIKSQKSSSK